MSTHRTDPSHPMAPSRLWRWWDRGLKWVWWTLFTAWTLVLLMVVVLNVFIVPRLSDWKDDVAIWLGRQLDLSVHIDRVEVERDGLVARLQVLGLRFEQANGDTVLQVPKAEFALSARNALTLQFDHLVLHQPEWRVERNAQGQWVVAGVALATPQAMPLLPGVSDWFFNQPVVQLRQGRMQWRLSPQAPWSQWQAIEVQLTNGVLNHELALQATPPEALGDRFELAGRLTEPLISGRTGDPSTWQGEWFVQSPRVDVAAWLTELQVKDGLHVQAQGPLRMWATQAQGRLTQADLDLNWAKLALQWPQRKQALQLSELQGRVSYRWRASEREHELHAEDLDFRLSPQLAWPKTPLTWRWSLHPNAELRSMRLQAGLLDVGVLTQLVQNLGTPNSADALWRRLSQLKPTGRLEALNLAWVWATPEAPGQLSVQAQGRQLSWKALKPRQAGDWALPGVQGVDVQLNLQPQGGDLELAMTSGLVDWPGLWDEPQVAIDRAQVGMSWTNTESGLNVVWRPSSVANGDAQVQWQGRWRREASTSDWGHLDLTANVPRALAHRVPRYLPSALSPDVRRYLLQALSGGRVTEGRIEVVGDLSRFPFDAASSGPAERLVVQAKLADLGWNFAPQAQLQNKPWPGFVRLNTQLSMRGMSLGLSEGTAQLRGQTGLSMRQLQAKIPNLRQPVLTVSGVGTGDLSGWLRLVNQTALEPLMGGALAQATGQGKAQLDLQLALPLGALDQTRVTGKLQLSQASLRLQPTLPALQQLKGGVRFTEQGLQLNEVTANALGHPVVARGGLHWAATAPAAGQPQRLSLRGLFTADALRRDPGLEGLSRLGQRLQGESDYQVDLDLQGGRLSWRFQSSLQGLSSTWPAPLDKPARMRLPLTVFQQWEPQSEETAQLGFSLGDLLEAQYRVRSTPGRPLAPLSGRVRLGPKPATALAQSNDSRDVVWDVQWPKLDVGEWQQAVDDVFPAPARGGAPLAANPWWPQRLRLDVRELKLGNRWWQSVQVLATQQGAAWVFNLKGQAFNGVGQFTPAQPSATARLNLDFQRLAIPEALPEPASSVALVKGPTPATASRSELPTLRLTVQNLLLKDKPWGRMEIEAFNRPQATGGSLWQMRRLDLSMPEAEFKAQGDWSASRPSAQTQLDFQLKVKDAGAFLSRFGMPGAVRAGQGDLQGRLGWDAIPLSPNLRSMSGQFKVNIEKGQFLKSEPGVGRFLGVLSLQSLPRRLTLDFRDLFSQGFAFDFFRGDVNIQQGVARSENLQMKGVAATVFMDGWANVNEESQDLKVLVVPELNAGTASIMYSAVNPVVGLTSFLAQYVLRQPLIRANTEHMRISGTWSDPVVDKIDPETGQVLSSSREKKP